VFARGTVTTRNHVPILTCDLMCGVAGSIGTACNPNKPPPLLSSSLRFGATTEDNGFVPESLTELECLYDSTIEPGHLTFRQGHIRCGQAVSSVMNKRADMIMCLLSYKATSHFSERRSIFWTHSLPMLK